MARTGQIQKAFESNEFSVEVVPADGDCWYNCIARAFLGIDPDNPDDELTISGLRARIADQVSDDTVSIFRIAHDAGLPGYEFMRRPGTNAETVRGRMRLTSRQVGSGRVIWANDFEVRTTANIFRCVLLLFDMEARLLRNAFVRIDPDAYNCHASISDQERPMRFILLQRTKRQHYNLVLYRGRKSGLWPPPQTIGRLWNLDAFGDDYVDDIPLLNEDEDLLMSTDDELNGDTTNNPKDEDTKPHLSRSKRSRHDISQDETATDDKKATESVYTGPRLRSGSKKVSASTVTAAPPFHQHRHPDPTSSSSSPSRSRREEAEEEDAHTGRPLASDDDDDDDEDPSPKKDKLPRRSPRSLSKISYCA